ncbi:4-hydroxybenzoate 3-monooxygenase [Rhodobacterales bacterium HKCCSP123]|nr:4-hydroxybenzoate 3-monooxygenase [Rhodobacterales bacterium HKCCSP123]
MKLIKDNVIRTQVAIVGAGPAGMLLAHILRSHGIDSVVMERRTAEHVQSRIRAGVLEHDTSNLLREYGFGPKMDQIGKPKNGTMIVWESEEDHFIDVHKWTGKRMFAYGQTYLTKALYEAHMASGAPLLESVSDVTLNDIASERPYVTACHEGRSIRIDCDFIAGCDGARGICVQSIPSNYQRVFEKQYPFSWLGIMVERPPLEEFTYCFHNSGFALAAQRTPTLSRYYIQVPAGNRVEDWSDQRFWDVLLNRFPLRISRKIQTGPSIEKSIAPLRSIVREPLRYGRLFLAGDSAHIVPPTGAKGLNLAISDVHYLGTAFSDYFKRGSTSGIDRYSEIALRRIWAAQSLSTRLTMLLHRCPDEDPFESKLRQAYYTLLLSDETAQSALAHEYAGPPLVK